VSTPPFVEIPQGVVVERWSIRASERAVMHTGLGRTGDWIVLVPGFTGSKEDFIAVLPLLADAGIDALAFDQLGQYESDGSDDPADYDLRLLAADLASIIDLATARRKPATRPLLVGHSFGGLVAQQALANGVDVSAFVALCTGPGALPPHRHGGLQDLIDALPHTDMAAIWSIMREQAAGAGRTSDQPDVRDFLRRRWMGNNPHQIREFAHLLMTAPALTSQVRARVDAGLPATVVWGEHDDAWPIDVQKAMAADWGGASIQLDGLGHSPNAEAPQALANLLISRLRTAR
jgi:pimeloyl-ACP methyl ester carboxylesterase